MDRNAYYKLRKSFEMSYLEYWYKHPEVEARLTERNFASKETRDLFHIFRLNREHNHGRYINGCEVLDALADDRNKRYEYLLNCPELLIDVMSGEKYSFNCIENFRITEKWLAERRNLNGKKTL